MQIHVFRPVYSGLGNAHATHRKSYGYDTIGWRVVEEIDEAKLSTRGRRLVELMYLDLSDVLSDDDLVPRLVRRQTTVGITEAATILGFPAAAAKCWVDAYGDSLREPDPEWYDRRFHRTEPVEDAINATAELPGIAVRPTRFADPVPLNDHPLDDSPEHRERQARRWSHMLRRACVA